MTLRKQSFIPALLLLLALPATVSAATISLQALPAVIGAGDTLRVTVLLTSATPVNAFSGELLYSAALEPIAVSDGNSLVSMWITRPVVTPAGTPIIFAGITPGGFSTTDGALFSVLFRAKAAGRADVSLKDIEVLRNDGTGGIEPTSMRALTLSIRPKSSGGYTESSDNVPPEAFVTYFSTDTQLFSGRSYLVFAAVDKGSGIERYMVAESRLPSFLHPLFTLSWKETESPYLIADQRLVSTVYIKAIDRAGNERLSIYPPRYLLTGYEGVTLLVILMIFVFLWYKKWGKRSRKNP